MIKAEADLELSQDDAVLELILYFLCEVAGFVGRPEYPKNRIVRALIVLNDPDASALPHCRIVARAGVVDFPNSVRG